ncbi:MAG: DUF4397 domain-containing protein [Chromatiales bacterium]|nr:MAG: DUF4397 domain-containing protein [Chromatiales bacterium]
MMRRFAPFLMLCAAMAGCDDLSDSLGSQGAFQTLHAVPDLQATTYFIRETPFATLDYIGNTSLLQVGTGTYPLRYEVRRPNETELDVLLRVDVPVDANREYTYVLSGTAAAVDFITWERAARAFTDDSILATEYGHAALGFGPVDFYLEAPGANLPGATPRASLAYQEELSDVDVAPGDYVLTVTTQGQVGDVLFQSDTFTLTERTNVLFALLSGADQGTAPLLVRVLGDPFIVTLQDALSDPGLRAAHSVLNDGNVDFVVNDDFASPLISDVAFKGVTAYTPSPVTGVDVPLDITPTGDPGTPLVEDALVLENGVAYSLYYIGTTDNLGAVQLLDDNRRLAEFAKFRVFEGAANYFAVDVYVVEPGDDYRDFFPSISGIGFGNATNYLEVSPGVYDIVFTPQGIPDTIIAQLQNQDLIGTGLYSILVVDTDDVNVAELVFYDDVP